MAKELVEIVRIRLTLGHGHPIHNANLLYSPLLSNPRFFEILEDRQSTIGTIAALTIIKLLEHGEIDEEMPLSIT